MFVGTETIFVVIASIVAITLHECSHGYVANYFGDPTAKEQGRLTLNPLAHIDPFGTVILPLLLKLVGMPAFGFAKPVPVNVSRLRDTRNHSFLVSIAGPATNIFLALFAVGICRITGVTISDLNELSYGTWTEVAYFFAIFGLINVSLAIFNMLPIPPLDGSALIERVVPRRHLPRYFALRERALPIVLILFLVNSFTLHIGSGLYNWAFDLFERLAFPS